MSSEQEPASFSALQVYNPSSSALTFVKCNTLSFSDRVKLSLDQCISGVEPSSIEQFRLTLSPFSTPSIGPNTFTTGATEKILKSIKLDQAYTIQNYIFFLQFYSGFPLLRSCRIPAGIWNVIGLTRKKGKKLNLRIQIA